MRAQEESLGTSPSRQHKKHISAVRVTPDTRERDPDDQGELDALKTWGNQGNADAATNATITSPDETGLYAL